VKNLLQSASGTLIAFLLATVVTAAAPLPVASGSFNGCPARGLGGDPELNLEKNRSAVPTSVTPITVAQMSQLPTVPASYGRIEAKWPANIQSSVRTHEANAVVFTGYVVNVTHETGDPSNCGSTKPRDEDVEVYLSGRPGVTAGADVILAEVTPRWRAVYATWTAKNLKRYIVPQTKVRVTGWLIYDQEAWPTAEGKQATPWEIEPITRIQVRSGGAWTDL
jgi:hypothetical protein